jgi:hypothetical protein
MKRTIHNAGSASALSQSPAWLRHQPTRRMCTLTIRGPRTASRWASSWPRTQSTTTITCPPIAPASPGQPATTPAASQGIHDSRAKTRSSSGARAHASATALAGTWPWPYSVGAGATGPGRESQAPRLELARILGPTRSRESKSDPAHGSPGR